MKKIFLSLSLLALLSNTTQAAEQNLNIYSARHYSVDKNLYDTFTKQTGIKVNLIEGEGNELMKRLELEGKNSPADILLTVDAGLLWKADQQKLFQPITSDILNSRIPEDVRAKDGSWYAFAKRARVIIYEKTKGKPEGLERYEDLAKPAYKGMVCVRTSNNLYNQSLLTTIIKADGETAATEWVKGFVANFARTPQANDVAQIKGVAAGACRVAVVNSYYVGKLIASGAKDQLKTVENIAILFPNQNDRGTHINYSGAGVTKTAKNKENAVKFLEFLASDEGQKLYAYSNSDYPIVPSVAMPPQLKAFGTFKQDIQPAEVLGSLNPTAIRVMDAGGWK